MDDMNQFLLPTRFCYGPCVGHRGGSILHPKGSSRERASEEHTARNDVFSWEAQIHHLLVLTQKNPLLLRLIPILRHVQLSKSPDVSEKMQNLPPSSAFAHVAESVWLW